MMSRGYKLVFCFFPCATFCAQGYLQIHKKELFACGPGMTAFGRGHSTCAVRGQLSQLLMVPKSHRVLDLKGLKFLKTQKFKMESTWLVNASSSGHPGIRHPHSNFPTLPMVSVIHSRGLSLFICDVTIRLCTDPRLLTMALALVVGLLKTGVSPS